MVWVRSEYAEELAVVSAWLMALLPWSLTYGRPMGGRYVAIRFPLFIYEALQGFGLPSHTGFLTPLNALDRSINAGLTEFGQIVCDVLESEYIDWEADYEAPDDLPDF